MKNIKKGLIIGTLCAVGVTALMLILQIFGIKGLNFFKGTLLKVLFTTITLASVGFFSISGISLLKRNKPVAIVSLSLLALSAILFLIGIWSGVNFLKIYGKITICVSIISVLFLIIVSNVLKLWKNYLWLQIITYGVLSALCFIICLCVFSVLSNWDILWKLIAILAILSVTGVISISVLSGKQKDENVKGAEKEEFVKIRKTELESLKNEIADLKKQLSSK